jgi:hypothetical protein
MNQYNVTRIYPSNRGAICAVKELLATEDLQLDKNIDYIAGIYDDNRLIATGSLYCNSLRCFAIDKNYQGEALLNTLLTHLVNVQYERGHYHLFIYTKTCSAKYFKQLGFYEIATIPGMLTFLENKPNAFKTYINKLKKETESQNSISKANIQGAIVMNANPFTLGHQYLIETAASQCDLLHLFIVSEDSSIVPYEVRKQLIQAGTNHIHNLVLHDSDSYMISNSTFPAYFQKDEQTVIQSQAELDIAIFSKIADALHITKRFVGEEPFSSVTKIYNDIMIKTLQDNNIDVIVVKRKECNTVPISASAVRQLIKEKNIEGIRELVPQTTYNFFKSEAAHSVIKRIQETDNVIHY